MLNVLHFEYKEITARRGGHGDGRGVFDANSISS